MTKGFTKKVVFLCRTLNLNQKELCKFLIIPYIYFPRIKIYGDQNIVRDERDLKQLKRGYIVIDNLFTVVQILLDKGINKEKFVNIIREGEVVLPCKTNQVVKVRFIFCIRCDKTIQFNYDWNEFVSDAILSWEGII